MSSSSEAVSGNSDHQYLCDATQYSKFFFFWNEETYYSQWVSATMHVYNQTFLNCEQYMMYQKAMLFNDQEIAKRILQSTNPEETKALGRKVSNFDGKIWEANKVRIVYEGNYAKFSQNDDLKKDLLSRPDVEYVEASPDDAIWGIGLEENDSRAKHRDQWLGQNLLGRIITRKKMKRFREENYVEYNNTSIASDSGDFNSASSDESVVESNLKKQPIDNSRELSYYKIGCDYESGLGGVEKDYLKALELFSKGADEGCLKSMNRIGYFYDEGLGVEKDYVKAFEWYLKAAVGGLAKSQFNIGTLYYMGQGVEQDYSKALEWYLKASENGHADAQFYIGLLYDKGKGVEQDYIKAFEWYLKAAKNGGAAQFNVGYFYENGKGVEKDYVKAFECYLKAADEGYLQSIPKVGYFYDVGFGVVQDYGKALEWYLKAAENGDIDAQYNVGYSYENGQGVEKDYVKAFEWYLKAAENGDASSQCTIGYFYEKGKGVEQEYTKALEWLMKSSENGYVDAQFNIGLLYENGKGVEQDDFKAFEWHLKAAENGNGYAQFNIGYRYETGKGVRQDTAKAFEWYFKSAENGQKGAQFNVGHYFENGEGVEKDMKAALYWKTKGLNDMNFTFIEPYHEFGIGPLKNYNYNDLKPSKSENELESLEQVIIRFSEKDFKVSNNLSNSKYLSTMLNSNWRDLNEKHEGQIILDLRSIENSIFEDETNYIQIFELYFNYLTRNELPITDCELKLKLIELSRYLGDDECILKIIRDSTILLRFYILFKFELIEPIHIAIANCYVTESSESALKDLSENVLEVLLTQSELSSQAKRDICDAFEKKFKRFPSSIIFNDNKVIHLKFSTDCTQNEINFNNTDITLKLEEYEKMDKVTTLKMNCSHNFQIFGENAKFYIQLYLDDNVTVGLWLDFNVESSTTFYIPHYGYKFIHLLIFT